MTEQSRLEALERGKQVGKARSRRDESLARMLTDNFNRWAKFTAFQEGLSPQDYRIPFDEGYKSEFEPTMERFR